MPAARRLPAASLRGAASRSLSVIMSPAGSSPPGERAKRKPPGANRAAANHPRRVKHRAGLSGDHGRGPAPSVPASGAVTVILDTGRYTVRPGTGRSEARRWLARLSFLLVAAAAAVLVVFGELRSIGLLAAGLVSVVVSLAGAFWFLAGRGIWRWISLAVVVLSPVAALIAFALVGLLWVAAVSAAAWALAGLVARAALAPDPAAWAMPVVPARSRARRPFLIMNPRSGG